MKKAVIITPTYNERGNIEKTISALIDVFKKVKHWHLEILVVDDTSPDKTYELVQELQKSHKQLHLLINKNKAGLGGAYLKGMDYAFEKMKADVVFEFDADLSHDPQKIPAFLAKIEEGYDFVLGSRYIKGGSIPQDWGFHRKFLSVVGNIFIMVVLTDFRIHDWTSGFRAITKEVFISVEKEMRNERFTGYSFQIGFLHKAVRRGFRIAEVPFAFVDRTFGHSKLGPEYIKNNLVYILKVRMHEILNHRIFKFVIVGGLGAAVQLSTLQLWRMLFPYQLAYFFSVETAVVSNFIFNNLWTFADRKIGLGQLPIKFVQFNFASAGSIIIQQIVAFTGEFGIGLFALFSIPIIGFMIDTGTVYAVFGILIGMFWNFFAYNRFIWKKKQT